jgi:putative zinc finger protein
MAESADHITCQEVVELVNDYLERTLPPGEMTVFEQHLNFCDGCDLYVEQLKRTVETVGEIREEDVPAEAKDRLLSAFRDWKRS